MNLNIQHRETETSIYQRLTKELSSYKEKVKTDEGLEVHVVNDPYFLKNGTWSIDKFASIENFREEVTRRNFNRKHIFFRIKNPKILLEIKYLFFRKVFDDGWTINTLFVSGTHSLKHLELFLDKAYPKINSILDLDIEKTDKRWLMWLQENGIATHSKDKRRDKPVKNPITSFLYSLYNDLSKLLDFRDEWDKEVWDVRNLNQKYGIYYNHARSHVNLDFTVVKSTSFRSEIQKWLKMRLLSNDITWGTAHNYMVNLPSFLDFIFELEPTWTNLNDLSRAHFEKYLDFLHKENEQRQRVAESYYHVVRSISCANKFLEGLQAIKSPLAPKTDVRTIIFRYDRPKKIKKSKKVDYIPDAVLQQLFDNINYLHEEVQPIIWISFKTGLRLSDTLRLTQDCLVRINGKYHLISDVTKTYISDHSIPIDDELANVIAVLIKNSKEKSNEENNPQRYIFVRYRGIRKGRPYSADWIGETLNSLAKEKKIVNEKGELYHFRMHQFRHTYAVKMLNSGADIFTVQQLLAHASPEMTLVYARLLDTTKRKAFEEAMKQGAFSFDVNGEMKQIKSNEEIPEDILEMLWREQKLSAVDNPYGTCHARINGTCPHAEEPPCLTCNGGSPCKDLAIGFSELDVQKYELLVKTSSKTIEALEQRGRHEIAEKNKKNLDRYQNILNTIKSGKIIFGRLDRIKRKQGFANA
jgi:integrase